MKRDFQKFKVYQTALNLLCDIDQILPTLPADLNQYLRQNVYLAAQKIPVLIARGGSAFYKTEIIALYREAREAVYDCVAYLDYIQNQPPVVLLKDISTGELQLFDLPEDGTIPTEAPEGMQLIIKRLLSDERYTDLNLTLDDISRCLLDLIRKQSPNAVPVAKTDNAAESPEGTA